MKNLYELSLIFQGLEGSLCGAQFPKIVSGKSNYKWINIEYLVIFILK